MEVNMDKFFVLSQDKKLVGLFDVILQKGYDVYGYIGSEGFLLGKYTYQENIVDIIEQIYKHYNPITPFKMPKQTECYNVQ